MHSALFMHRTLTTRVWHHRVTVVIKSKGKNLQCLRKYDYVFIIMVRIFFFIWIFIFFISFVTKFSNKSEIKTNMKQTKQQQQQQNQIYYTHGKKERTKKKLKWKLFWMHTAAIKNYLRAYFCQRFLISVNKKRAQTIACIGYFWLDNSPLHSTQKFCVMDQIERHRPYRTTAALNKPFSMHFSAHRNSVYIERVYAHV